MNYRITRSILLFICLFSTPVISINAHAESFPRSIIQLRSNRAVGRWIRADQTKDFFFIFRPGKQSITLTLKAKSDAYGSQPIYLQLFDGKSKRGIPGGQFYVYARQNYTQESKTVNINNSSSVIIKISAQNNTCTSITPGGRCPHEENYYSGDFIVMLSEIRTRDAVRLKPGVKAPSLSSPIQDIRLRKDTLRWKIP